MIYLFYIAADDAVKRGQLLCEVVLSNESEPH